MNIIDKKSLLTKGQVTLLHNSLKLPFELGDYASLDDVLTKLKVDIVIESGVEKHYVPGFFKEAIEYWRKEIYKLRSLNNDSQEELTNEISRLQGKINFLADEIGEWDQMTLRGLYVSERNTISLYPKSMAREYSGKRVDDLLVATLARETMHAYFNRPRHKSFPYVPLVEEPLAEFGMLLYLKDTGSKSYQWAYHDVENKNTCHKYGAKLMDRCLAETAPSATRSYLESYKLHLDPFFVPEISMDGAIDLPARDTGDSTHIVVDGQKVEPKWEDVYRYPPRFFYDATTRVLGLNGDWEIVSTDIFMQRYSLLSEVLSEADFDEDYVSAIYLDSHFICDDFFPELFSKFTVLVSPENPHFRAADGIPVSLKTNKPVLDKYGDGLYGIYRNGKWGVIDDRLKQIAPCKYGHIWPCDENGLMMVVCDDDSFLYGLINRKGQEQVPPIYDDMSVRPDGTYSVKKDGKDFVIGKDGKVKRPVK